MKTWASWIILGIGLSYWSVFSWAQDAPEKGPLPDKDGWIALFNGKDLTGWEKPQFGGEGDVTIQNGEMTIAMGAMVSGIRYTQDFPKENYEVEVVAKRTMGQDFFATITFPIGKEYASFVTGGWGGQLFGVSCVNGLDASENEYRKLIVIKANQWYKVRVRVTSDAVECFLDDKVLAKVPRAGNSFRTRFEVDLSQPLGITNYCCESVIRSVKYRKLEDPKPTEPKSTEK